MAIKAQYIAAETRRFLESVKGDCPCFEIRILNCDIDRSGFIVAHQGTYKPKIVAGWFDNANDAVVELQRVKGVSAYITVNTVKDSLLARVNNRLAVADITTKDTDITRLDHLFLDSDPERDAKISSTDGELAAAVTLLDHVLDDVLNARESAHWGKSGNGAWALVRIDLPNDEFHRNVVAEVTDYLHVAEKIPGASIDEKTKNPARIMCLPGTVKCKGDSIKSRPHRLATIDSDGGEREPFDIVGWWEANRPAPVEEPKPPAPKKTGKIAYGSGGDPEKRFRAYIQHMKASIEGDDGSKRLYNVFCEANRFGVLETDALAIVTSDYNIPGKSIPIWSPKELAKKARDVYAKHSDEFGNKPDREDFKSAGRVHIGTRKPVREPGADENEVDQYQAEADEHFEHKMLDGRPTIEITDVGLASVTAQVLHALGTFNNPPEVYSAGTNLVWVRSTTDAEPYVYVDEMSQSALRNRFAEVATFEQTFETKNGQIRREVFPPSDIVRAVMAQKTWAEKVAPPLDGVINCPFFTRDGRLVITPGYNRDARIFYNPPAGIESVLPIPDRPTSAEVAWARSLILDHALVDFPFDSNASRANAVAVMIMGFVREMIDGATPLHHFESSTEGVGKGKLANTCAYPALGHTVISAPQKEGDAEWRKALTVVLKSGRSHIFFDNLNNPTAWNGDPQPIDSGVLANALTQAVWSDRLLGSSTEVVLKVRAIWMSAGNNNEFSRELWRRINSIRLRTPTENPSQRTDFKYDLEEWLPANRLQLLRACLILVQHWIAEGRPAGSQVMGSFENYAKVMGGILGTAGIDGFLGNRKKTITKDAESCRWPVLVKEWYRVHGPIPIRPSDLHAIIIGAEDMQNSFADILGEGTALSQKQRVGHALKKHTDRVWGDYRIVLSSVKGSGGVPLYKLIDPNTQEVEVDE